MGLQADISFYRRIYRRGLEDLNPLIGGLEEGLGD